MRAFWITVIAAMLAAGAARADYPTKPIKLLVGFAAGGPVDVSSRLIAERMAEELKQPVVVENRPGANGSIAIQALMASPADGYTLMTGTTGTLTIAPAISKKLAYDTKRDLVPVAGVIGYSYLLVARSNLPFESLKDFVAYAKANPGRISFGSPGIGTVNHMGMERFALLTGTQMVHVPYKGDSEVAADILARNVDVAFVTFSLTAPQVKAGKMRALAISARSRSPMLPDVPTVPEAGVADFDLLPWAGIIAPRGTPPDVVARVNAAVNKGLRHPDTQRRFAEMNFTPLVESPDSFSRLIETELQRWREVAERVNISID